MSTGGNDGAPTRHLDQEFELRSASYEERVRILLSRYHDEHDVTAREMLVTMHLPMAYRCARRFAGQRDDLEDLKQVAALALLQAIERFDSGRERPFAAYASPTIVGSLHHYIRDHSWSVRVPRPLQERARAVVRVVADLEASESRPPSLRRISEASGLSEQEAEEALLASRAFFAASIEDRFETFGEAGAPATEEPGFQVADARATVTPLMRRLEPRERAIVWMRYHEDLGQREIAERVGISQMHVSRLLRQSLDSMCDSDRLAA